MSVRSLVWYSSRPNKLCHMCTLALVTGINKEGDIVFHEEKKHKKEDVK